MIFTVSFKASRDRLRIGTSASFSAAWTILGPYFVKDTV